MNESEPRLLFEEVPVERSVWRGLHCHLQHLHALLQPGVSGAEACSLESLHRGGGGGGEAWSVPTWQEIDEATSHEQQLLNREMKREKGGNMIFWSSHIFWSAYVEILCCLKSNIPAFPLRFASVSSQRTHCGELVSGDLLLALCNGVEEQVLQAGQDACLPSPARTSHTHTQRREAKKPRPRGFQGAWRSDWKEKQPGVTATAARRWPYFSSKPAVRPELRGNGALRLNTSQDCAITETQVLGAWLDTNSVELELLAGLHKNNKATVISLTATARPGNWIGDVARPAWRFAKASGSLLMVSGKQVVKKANTHWCPAEGQSSLQRGAKLHLV